MMLNHISTDSIDRGGTMIGDAHSEGNVGCI